VKANPFTRLGGVLVRLALVGRQTQHPSQRGRIPGDIRCARSALSVIWPVATNAASETTTVDASLLEMILKAQDGVRKLMERRAKLLGARRAGRISCQEY
jgi:hypothetical protein